MEIINKTYILKKGDTQMSRVKEELFICNRCVKCKNNCKVQSSVMGADVVACKKDRK